MKNYNTITLDTPKNTLLYKDDYSGNIRFNKEAKEKSVLDDVYVEENEKPTIPKQCKAVCTEQKDPTTIVFGGSSSMRTNGFLLPNILTSIQNKISYIVADPTGECFSKTYKLAKKYGYNIKLLNLNSHSYKESNAWNILSAVNSNYSRESKSELLNDFTELFLKTDDTKEELLFKALVSYVAYSKDFKGNENERNIASVFDLLVRFINRNGSLEEFQSLEKDDISLPYYISAIKCSDILSPATSLLNKLDFLNNENAREFFAHDEFETIEEQKEDNYFAIYIIANPYSESHKRIVSAFLYRIYEELINFGIWYDYPVHLFLQNNYEFGQIKKLPYTARLNSNLSTSLLFTDEQELKDTYKAYNVLCDDAILLNMDYREDIYDYTLHPLASEIEELENFIPNYTILEDIHFSNWTRQPKVYDEEGSFTLDAIRKEDKTAEAFNNIMIGEELEGTVINVSNNGYFVRVNNNTDIFCKDPKNVNASRGNIVKIHILGKDNKTMRIWGKLEELIEEKSEYNNSSEFFKVYEKGMSLQGYVVDFVDDKVIIANNHAFIICTNNNKDELTKGDIVALTVSDKDRETLKIYGFITSLIEKNLMRHV